MASISSWIKAFRLRTLPLALSTIITGSVVAAIHKAFDPTIFALCCLTTLLLQILSNLANDYGDAISGADQHRIGPERMVQSGAITKREMQLMIGLFVTLSLISGISLLTVAFSKSITLTFVFFLIIGIGAILSAINYTIGKNPYGYKGWGDFFVFLFFGIIGVWGTHYLYTKIFDLTVLLPAATLGFLSTGVLNMNNMRDYETDKLSQKRSLVVIYGRRFGMIYHILLIILAVLSLTIFTAITDAPASKWIYLLAIPLFGLHLFKVITNKVPEKLDSELKRLAMTTLATVLLWGAGILIF